jgi:hypothetical protein
MRYASPHELVQYGQASQDRKEAVAQRLMLGNQANQTRLDYLEEKRQEAERNATNQEQRDSANQEFRAQQLTLQQKIADSNEILKRLGLDIQQQRADQTAGQQAQKQTQNLGTALERAGLPEADATLRAAEEALQKRPDLPEYMSGAKSMLPDVALPQDITSGRQAFQKLFNITLKTRSGAAVTPQEFERLKQEFGTGVWKKPEQFRAALDQARNIMANHFRGVAAGYGPDALEGYNQNLRDTGGTPLLESQGDAAQTPQGAPGPTQTTAPVPSLETAVKNSGWAYEPQKFDYRISGGKVQRKTKSLR